MMATHLQDLCGLDNERDDDIAVRRSLKCHSLSLYLSLSLSLSHVKLTPVSLERLIGLTHDVLSASH